MQIDDPVNQSEIIKLRKENAGHQARAIVIATELDDARRHHLEESTQGDASLRLATQAAHAAVTTAIETAAERDHLRAQLNRLRDDVTVARRTQEGATIFAIP
jgi:hypothetical protein